MKKLKTDSDIGSVLIGDENWTFAVPNIGGDGTTQVRIYDSDAEFYKDPWAMGMGNAPWAKRMEFISSVQGRFGIFSYDCDYHELLRGEMNLSDALCILDGRYGIYRGEYKVAFVKWENFAKAGNPSFLTRLLDSLPHEPRSKDVADDPGFWTDGKEILCPSASECEVLAEFLSDALREVSPATVVTGWYDPSEDGRSGEQDDRAGFNYIRFE